MAEPAETFAALLARVRQGDERALQELIQHYERDIRLVARLKLGPVLRRYLDSLDLVQSVHLALFQALRQGKFDITSPEGLIRVAVMLVQRKLATHLRQLYRRQRIIALMRDSGAFHNLFPTHSGPTDDPTLIAEVKDYVELLLRDLDEIDGNVLRLRLEGYTTAEAARAIGMDADVLRVRLSRLRKRLGKEWPFLDWL